MKKSTAQTVALLALAVGLTANLFWSCSTDKLFKDLNLYIRSDVLLNPLTIEIVDANPANTTPIPFDKVKVEVLGPDRAKIYSVVGERKIKLDGAYLNLGIRRFDAPSVQRPLYFGIRLTAPDYVESLQWYSLTNGEGFQIARQEMVSIAAPPPGVTVVQKNFPVDGANGVAQDVLIETPASAGDVPQRAQFVIPAGTKLFEGNDTSQPLDGTVRVTLVQFNEQSGNFPTSAGSTLIVESNGKPRKPGSSAPAGYTNMNMTVGGSTVGTFSNPIQAAIILSGDEDNPDTGQPVAVGDSLSIWSLTEPGMVWQKESRVALTNVNGEIWCPWEMSHLSWWAAGWFPPMNRIEQGYQNPDGTWNTPDASSILTVSSEIPISNLCGTGGRYFYTELRSAGRGQLLLSDYQQYFNGRKINLASLLRGIPEGGVIWRIFSGDRCSPGALLYESQVLTGGDAVLSIGSVLPNDGLNVSFAMEGTCGEGSVVIPTAPAYYRESGNPCFRLLGVLQIGQGCSANLYKGKKYDFAVYYGGLERIVDGITIPQNDTTILLKDVGGFNFNDTLYIRYSGAGGNNLLLDYRNVKIPDDLCEEFKKYFF